MRGRARTWLLIAVALAVVLYGAGAFVFALPQFGGELSGERLARARANPHYHDGVFVNPLPPAGYRAADVWNLIAGQFFGNEMRVPPAPLPLVQVDAAALKNRTPEREGLRAFWIGHASVYIEND